MGKGDTSQTTLLLWSTVNEESLSIAQTWTLNVSEEAAGPNRNRYWIYQRSQSTKTSGNSSKEIVDMIFKNNATVHRQRFTPWYLLYLK